MRRYSESDERNVRLHALLREWVHSGLLDEGQGKRLGDEVRTDLRRTNSFLRIVLFLFTGLIVGAAVLLVLEVLQIHDTPRTTVVCGIAAVLSFALAEILIGEFRLYRFGVEEALAVAAVVLLVIATGGMFERADFESIAAAMLTAGAIGSLGLYLRFGFVYAGIAAIACTAMIPFPLLHSPMTQRGFAAAILACIFLIARRYHLIHGDEFPGDDYAVFQTAAWAGLYVAVNLHMRFSGIPTGRFYWATYAMIWIFPIAGLRMGIRNRDRLLMDVSAAMALVTLATTKAYLGLQHQSWDPILAGLLLMGTAIVIRRWLASGPDGERYGFTPVRTLSRHARLMTVVSTASAAFQPQPSSPSPEPAAARPHFEGGRSGGAGASGEF
jgi:hypothetical protein